MDLIELHRAVDEQNIESVIRLAEGNPNIDRWDDNGFTAVMKAAMMGNQKIVDVLVRNGCSLEKRDASGWRLMHRIASKDDIKMMQFLMDCGIDLNSRTRTYWYTPLHIAAHEGKKDSLICLLKHRNIDTEKPDKHQQTSLHTAILQNNLNLVPILLKHGVNPNATDNKGNTPLHVIIQLYDKNNCVTEQLSLSTIQLLLEHGAKTCILNKDQLTPLASAVCEKAINIVKIIIAKAKSEIDTKCDKGKTSLYMAAENGDVNLVQILAEAGAELNVRIEDEDFTTPLHIAAHKGHYNVVRLLCSRMPIKYVDILNDKECTPLLLAVQEGALKTIEILIQCGAEIRPKPRNGQSILYIAAQRHDSKLLELFGNSYKLLKCAVKLNEIDTVLELEKCGAKLVCGHYITAIRINEDMELIKYIIQKVPDLNHKNKIGMCALAYTVQYKNMEAFKAILNKGVNPSPEVLYKAVYGKRLNMVKLLLKYPIDLEEKVLGYSPLWVAIYHSESPEIVKLLLDAGANPQSITKGLTCYQAALKKNNNTILNLINNALAIFNHDEKYLAMTCGKFDSNSLHQAASHENINAMQFLISQGFNINTLNCDFLTPLHLAVNNFRKKSVDFLLNFGADPNIKSNHSRYPTALHMAVVKMFCLKIIKLLIHHGADVNALNSVGNTPLFISRYPDYGIVLLEAGSNAFHRNTAGETFLHANLDYMVNFKDYITYILRIHDIDLDEYSNANKETVLYKAIRIKKYSFAETLIRHGASCQIGCLTSHETCYDLALMSKNERLIKLMSASEGLPVLTSSASIKVQNPRSLLQLTLPVVRRWLKTKRGGIYHNLLLISSNNNIENFTESHVSFIMLKNIYIGS